MFIQKKNTKKGVVIKFVFDDTKEYNLYLDHLTKLSQSSFEWIADTIKDVLDLFKEYYTESDSYCENKPAVVVFEDHLLPIASLIFLTLPLADNVNGLQRDL